MLDRYVELINSATVYDVCIKSPLQPMSLLSDRLNNTVLIKREDLQPIHSFKLRGAYNKISQLSDADRDKGVITSSAGNHAQGVAYSAQKLKLSATIVMPVTTPTIKVDAVKRYGATVVLYGDTYEESFTHAQTLSVQQGSIFIHPYDDPLVIAGQGTIAPEILKDCPEIDYLFVAVGGGGLISGIATYIKSVNPQIKIIGVEPDNSACMTAALAANERVVLDQVGIFADGVAVKQVGKQAFEIAKHYVDDMIVVSTDEICAAIKDIFEETRNIAEPAGALATAGLKAYVRNHTLSSKTLVTINCGANTNFDRLRHIAERAEMGENREAILSVAIPEVHGSFKLFCDLLGKRPITEFNYRYNTDTIAHVFVGVGLSNGESDRQALLSLLNENGYDAVDLTDNDVAKLHVRYMVGGHSSGVDNEKLFRFQFPERPGALRQFLTILGSQWNISLFHYRNHGAAYGRVLVGIQVPDSEMAQFRSLLDTINYSYFDETDNIAWQLFLK
jgi:threonine dehydratase